MQQILTVDYMETKATHQCRTYQSLHNATTRHLVIPCTNADRTQLLLSLYLSFVRHFGCKVADPFIYNVAPDDSEWLASNPGRFSSGENTIGTRQTGAVLDITVTLIAMNNSFWLGLILYCT